jgi:hypothetical protein|uniref:Uncharacterized protein n=1 Tax=Sipha flava TaxID=143950 RepID=A0A2S2QUF3_9HEMI
MAAIHNSTPKDVQSKLLEALDLAVPPKRKPRLMDNPYYHRLLMPILQSVNLEVTDDHQPNPSTSDLPTPPLVSAFDAGSNESFVSPSMPNDADPDLYFFRIQQNMTMYKVKLEELNGIRLQRPRHQRKSLWTRFKDSARNFYNRILD